MVNYRDIGRKAGNMKADRSLILDGFLVIPKKIHDMVLNTH